MKKHAILFIMLLTAAGMVCAQDAEAIVRSSRDRIKADTVSTRSRMTIQAKNGSTSERLILQHSKDGPQGKRTIIIFEEPSSVKGTRFLTIEKSGSADDRWIYLPELKKIRRVAASEGSGSFMGTDFSYDDISSQSRSVTMDTHRLLREEKLGSSSCYVIESAPKDTSYQYSKMIQWIDKGNQMALKIEMYNKRGELVKTVDISGIKEVQGRLTSTIMKMTTHAAGTSTTITTENIKYDGAIPDGLFTVQYLETGKIQ